MHVNRLEPEAIPTAMGWEFAELPLEPGILSDLEAVDRGVTAKSQQIPPDVEYEAVYGSLTSALMGEWSKATGFVPTCNDRKVWIVRYKGVPIIQCGVRGYKFPVGGVLQKDLWLVVDALTGEALVAVYC
jgi:hypothetical protein